MSNDTTHGEHPNQFALLRQRRFAPFFWTQFAGAANDNLFKFAFTVMVTYQLSVSWLEPSMAGLVIGALFILPFLLTCILYIVATVLYYIFFEKVEKKQKIIDMSL